VDTCFSASSDLPVGMARSDLATASCGDWHPNPGQPPPSFASSAEGGLPFQLQEPAGSTDWGNDAGSNGTGCQQRRRGGQCRIWGWGSWKSGVDLGREVGVLSLPRSPLSLDRWPISLLGHPICHTSTMSSLLSFQIINVVNLSSCVLIVCNCVWLMVD
jgi:hypothetical protein